MKQPKEFTDATVEIAETQWQFDQLPEVIELFRQLKEGLISNIEYADAILKRAAEYDKCLLLQNTRQDTTARQTQPQSDALVAIDVTQGIRGWFAVMYNKQTGEPINTGTGSHLTRAAALREAVYWAVHQEQNVNLLSPSAKKEAVRFGYLRESGDVVPQVEEGTRG